MGLIGAIWRFIGGNTLLLYGLIALAALGGFWGYGAYKHHQGYAAGSSHERAAWQKQRDKDVAQQAADKKAAQAEIDRLEAELQLDAQERKDAQADADLGKAQAASSTKKNICLPRGVGRALNKVGR